MRPEDILASYSFNSLRTIARVRSYPFAALRRPELIAALAERIFAADDLEQAIEQLTASELAVIEALIAGGGRLPLPDLADALLNQGVIDAPGPIRQRETIDRIAPATRRLDELCARLTARGLIFSEPKPEGTLAGPHDLAPGQVLFVPGPVQEAIRQRASARPESPPSPARGAPPAGADAPPVRGRLIVQPSYSVLVLPPLDEPTILPLSGIAETVRIAEVAEFRLTQTALYEAVQRGTSVADVIAFLEERGEVPLPQNVRYSLEAWRRAFDQVRLYRSATLVEGPAGVLDRLEATPTIQPLIVRRIGPQRLLLNDATAAEQAIVALGELPRVTRYDEAAARRRLRVSEDGTITLDEADLLLPIALRRVAEPLDDGRFQLTPERVRAAAASTTDGVTGLLKWLRASARELPPALMTRLRMWALPQDAVTLEQPLLLRLPPELLAELRAQPELAPLLADDYRPDAVVRVSPDTRDALLAALEARGLRLTATKPGGGPSSD